MTGKPGEGDNVGIEIGDFVHADPLLGIGRLVEIGPTMSTIRYFIGPTSQPFVDVEYLSSTVKAARLSLNSRVFFLDAGHWRVGRVDAIPASRDENIVVALPNAEGVLRPVEALEVRWRKVIDDPFAFLMSGGVETPLLADMRSSFLAHWRIQRAASHGVQGLVLSSVELHGHQVSAVRTVAADPVRRYLLADEVGLGKTIEAGALIKQCMADGAKRVLVLVPDHLKGQWAQELAGRFHLPIDGEQLQIYGHGEVSQWPGEVPEMLVVDEAHHMTRTGHQPPDVRLRVHRLATAATDLLLLTATPVRSNEAGFLDLLSMLDPDRYHPDDLDAFVRRVAARDELALVHRSLESVEDLFEFSYLAGQLREMFPNDLVLVGLIDAAEILGEDELVTTAHRIRCHLSESYRLHHRMIRTRRTPELTRLFGVRGRKRGRPFTLETSDQSDGLRLELLELLRSRLAAAMDEGQISPASACAIFGEVASRCGSLPAALGPIVSSPDLLHSDLSGGDWLSSSDHDRVSWLAQQIANSAPSFLPGFVESLSSLVGSRQVGRVVLFSVYTESCVAAFQAMEDRWGAHRVALHSVGGTSAANVAAIERWRTDPVCTLLFCDAGAEEGVNLQDADLLVNLDLPWQAPRLEQRLGRCDRFREGASEPISSVVLLYGDQPFSSAWFEFVADATHVFDESVSSLQYVLADIEDEFRQLAIRGGPSLMADANPSFEVRLAEERLRITAQDSLDAVSAPSTEEPLRVADGDRAFTSALTSWLEGVACGVKHVRPGVVVLQPRGRVQVPFD